MRTRRAAALLLAAALTAVLVRTSAAGDAALDEQILHSTQNKAAIALNGQRVALEKKILEHLTGKTPSTFVELKKTLDGIKTGLAAATDIPGDACAALADLLLRDEKMLMGAAALARGAPRLDLKIEQVFKAVADKHEATAAGAVSTAVARLLNVAASPEAADQLFDDRTPVASRTKAQQNAAAGKARLRASLSDDSAAAANLDAVLADFGAKDAIVYTQPQDPLYKYTNAAKFSHAAAEPTPAPAAAEAAPSLNKDEAAAAQNCVQAVKGGFIPVEKLCGVFPVGAAIMGGLLDALKQQLGTVSGVLINLGFILMGLVMGVMTGGVATIAKTLFAIGMGAFAIYKLVPALAQAVTDLYYAKDGSVERYTAIRQLAALLGGIAIMALLAVVGGKIGKALPTGWEAKIPGFKAKLPAPTTVPPGKFAVLLAKLADATEAKMEGETHPPKAPGQAPPSAVHSVTKSFVVVAEEARGGPKTGAAGKLAQKTVTDFLEKEIKPGEKVPPERAKALVEESLQKADAAVREHAANNPGEAANVDLSVAIVAKDASGASSLVSAKAGDASVFLRRGEALINQRPAPPVLERFNAVKGALKADGLSASEKLTASDLEGAENLTKLAETDPVLKEMLKESDVRAKRLELRAKTEPALAKRLDGASRGIDWMEYKSRVAAEPVPETALGSPRYKAPAIRVSPLKPGDVVFAASRSAADAAAEAHGAVDQGTTPRNYVRDLLSTEKMRAIENERAVAELSVPEEKPGFIERLASRLAGRDHIYRAVAFQTNAPVVSPPPGPPGPCTGPDCGPGNSPCVGPDCGAEPPPCVGPDCDKDEPPCEGPDCGKDAPPCAGPGCDRKTPRKVSPVKPVNPPIDPDKPTSDAGGSPTGGGGGGGGGGHDDDGKRPKVPTPGGFGGGGGGGGGGGAGGSGGGGGGGAGGSASDKMSPMGGGASAPTGPISAAGPSRSSFGPGSAAGVPAARTSAAPGAGGPLSGGHTPESSLASRFDGAPERPSHGGTAPAEPMHGLGAGDSGGLPRLTPRDRALATPAAPAPGSDAALKDRTAASSAYSRPGAEPAPGAVKTADEDYNYTYLAPAGSKYELPTDRPAGAPDNRYLLDLALQGSAALAAVYLLYHSDIGYLLGMTRRRKKTGGES